MVAKKKCNNSRGIINEGRRRWGRGVIFGIAMVRVGGRGKMQKRESEKKTHAGIRSPRGYSTSLSIGVDNWGGG